MSSATPVIIVTSGLATQVRESTDHNATLVEEVTSGNATPVIVTTSSTSAPVQFTAGPTPPPESASNTTLPGTADQIVDAAGAIYTLRMSDRAVLKDGVSTSLADVVQLWYINHVLWAYVGTGWKSYAGSWSATGSWRTKPTGFSTTAGLRYAVGPKVLTSHAGIQVNPGDNVSAIVAAAPAASTFVFHIGNYPQAWAQVRDGDTYIGLYDGVNGAVFDGEDASNSFAFWGNGAHVTIRNLFIKRYSAQLQRGQVDIGRAWSVIQDCDISYATVGAAFFTTDYGYHLLVGCRLHHNNQEGYAVHGDFGAQVPLVGITFDNCEMDNNNPTGGVWSGSEQGGGKCLNTQYLLVMFCHAHDNHGTQLWTDYNNIWTTYWANKLSGFGWEGIEHEISYDAQIWYNDVREWYGVDPGPSPGFFNEGAIFLGNSGGVDASNKIDIAYNLFAVSAATQTWTRCVPMRQQDRGTGNVYNVGIDRNVWNIYVHDNAFTCGTPAASDFADSLVGLAKDFGNDDIFDGPNRAVWDYNTYTVTIDFTNMWETAGTSGLSFVQWQAEGQDLNGTYIGPAPPGAGWSTISKNSHVLISGVNYEIATSDGTNDDTMGRGNDATKVEAGDKRYWEVTINIDAVPHNSAVGFCNGSQGFTTGEWLGQSVDGVGYYDDGTCYHNNGLFATLASYTVGDVLCFAVDFNANKWWVRVNNGGWLNAVIGSQNPATATGGFGLVTGNIYPALLVRNGGKQTANFLGPFTFTVPAGFSGA